MLRIRSLLRMTKAAAVALLLTLVAGCAGGVKYHDPNMDFGSIQTMAVLPFANLSKDQAAAERVRDVFTTMLLATGSVYVIPPGEVARGLSRTGMAVPTAPSPEEVKRFASITGVNGVMTGVLREYGEVRSGTAVANAISLSLQLLDADSGKVVWTASSAKGGITMSDRLFGGGGKQMDEVTREAVDDLLDKLFQ